MITTNGLAEETCIIRGLVTFGLPYLIAAGNIRFKNEQNQMWWDGLVKQLETKGFVDPVMLSIQLGMPKSEKGMARAYAQPLTPMVAKCAWEFLYDALDEQRINQLKEAAAQAANDPTPELLDRIQELSVPVKRRGRFLFDKPEDITISAPIKTGFKKFDSLIGKGGLQRHTTHIFASKSGWGKSTLALQTALNANVPVLIIDLEMSHMDWYARAMANTGGEVPDLSSITYENFEDIDGLPRFSDIVGLISQWATTHKGLIILDYLMVLAGETNQQSEVLGGYVRQLNKLAKKYDSSVMAFIQTNRTSSKKEGASINSLFGSDIVAQAAGSVTILAVDELQQRSLNIVKTRYGGGTDSVVPLEVDLAHSRVKERIPESGFATE